MLSPFRAPGRFRLLLACLCVAFSGRVPAEKWTDFRGPTGQELLPVSVSVPGPVNATIV